MLVVITRDKKYSIQDGFQFQFLAQFRLMKQKPQEQTIKLRYFRILTANNQETTNGMANFSVFLKLSDMMSYIKDRG